MGKFISFFTMYRYSHVVISFDKNCDKTYSFGRKNVYSIFNGGNYFNNNKNRSDRNSAVIIEKRDKAIKLLSEHLQ